MTSHITVRISQGDGEATLAAIEAGTLAPRRCTIVLLPGLWATAACFTRHVEQLSSGGNRVIALSMRGHGSSFQKSQVHALCEYGYDVAAALAALNIRHAVLCGHGAGAILALRAATLTPERVAALVLCSAAARVFPTANMGGVVQELLSQSAPTRATADRDAPLWRAVRQVCEAREGEAGEAHVRQSMEDLQLSQPLALRASLCSALRSEISRAELETLNVPALLLWATDDAYASRSDQAELQQLLGPKSQLKVFESGGHALLWRTHSHAAVLDAIRDFVQTTERSSAVSEPPSAVEAMAIKSSEAALRRALGECGSAAELADLLAASKRAQQRLPALPGKQMQSAQQVRLSVERMTLPQLIDVQTRLAAITGEKVLELDGGSDGGAAARETLAEAILASSGFMEAMRTQSESDSQRAREASLQKSNARSASMLASLERHWAERDALSPSYAAEHTSPNALRERLRGARTSMRRDRLPQTLSRNRLERLERAWEGTLDKFEAGSKQLQQLEELFSQEETRALSMARIIARHRVLTANV